MRAKALKAIILAASLGCGTHYIRIRSTEIIRYPDQCQLVQLHKEKVLNELLAMKDDYKFKRMHFVKEGDSIKFYEAGRLEYLLFLGLPTGLAAEIENICYFAKKEHKKEALDDAIKISSLSEVPYFIFYFDKKEGKTFLVEETNSPYGYRINQTQLE